MNLQENPINFDNDEEAEPIQPRQPQKRARQQQQEDDIDLFEKEEPKDDPNEKFNLIKKIEYIITTYKIECEKALGVKEFKAIIKEFKDANVSQLKLLFDRIISSLSSTHPKDYIYQIFTSVTRLVEGIANTNPNTKAPGFAEIVNNDPNIKMNVELASLQQFDFTSAKPIQSLSWNILGSYMLAKKNFMIAEAERNLILDQIVPNDIVNRFVNL
jgi:hypothetical protein